MGNQDNNPLAKYGGKMDVNPLAKYGGEMDVAPQQPTENAFQSFISGLTAPMENVIPRLRAALSGAVTGTSNLAKTVSPNYSIGAFRPTNYGQQLAEMIAPKNPDTLDKVISGITQYAPFAAMAPETALGRIGLGATAGGIENPEHPAGGAIIGALTGSIPSLINAPKAAFNVAKNYFTGPNLESAVSNMVNDLTSGGAASDTLDAATMRNIYKNYLNQSVPLSKQYNNLINNEAVQRGYSLEGSQGFPGISIQQSGKFINLSPDTKQLFDKILNDDSIKNAGGPLVSKIQNILSSPTFFNSHDVQSDLGAIANKFSQATKSDPANADTAYVLNQARNNLKSDIVSSLNDNGDDDLANKYQELSKEWDQNVVPYRENSSISKYIDKQNSGKQGKVPANVLGKVLENSSSGNKIRQDLLQNPDQIKLVLGQYLSKLGTPETMDLNSLSSSIKEIPDNMKPFLSKSGSEPQINTIVNAIDKLPTYIKRQKLAKWASGLVGAGTLGGLGIDIAHHL